MSDLPTVINVLYESANEEPSEFLPKWLVAKLGPPDVTDQGGGILLADFYAELTESQVARLLRQVGVDSVDTWEDGSPHSPLSPVFYAGETRLEIGGTAAEFRRVFRRADVKEEVPPDGYTGAPGRWVTSYIEGRHL